MLGDPMSTAAVRKWLLIWAALTVGLVYASSQIAVWLAQLSSCRSAGIPCWELVAALGTAGRALVHTILGMVLFVVLHRRMRQLGFGLIWTVGAALWLIGAMPFLVWTNNPWSVQFGPGVVYSPPIALLAMAMLLSLFLCFARPGIHDVDRIGVARAWQIAKFAAIHLTLVLLANIVTALTFVPFVSELARFVAFIIIGPHMLLRGMLTLGLPVGFVIWLDVAIFAAALAYLLFTQRPEEPATAVEAKPAAVPGSPVAMPRTTVRVANRAGFGKRGA